MAEALSALPGRMRILAWLRISREDSMILGLALAIVGLSSIIVNRAGFEMPAIEWVLRNLRLYMFICLLVVLAETVLRLAIARPGSPLRFLLSPEIGRLLLCRAFAALPVAGIAIMMPAFSAAKSSISRINPFAWDSTFIALDRAIHGTDPWRLLQPLMGHPAVTYAASSLYHAWFLLLYLGPIMFAFYVRDRQLRLSFFLGYLATWSIVGIVFANLLSSVGPCFVGPLLGSEHFAEQMAYLNRANETYPIAVLEVQQQLIDWYRAEESGLGRGITAMPSMHVALCWLYVLATWQIDRRLGYAFAAFFVAIQLASVHLAYHYAVDGYVSVVLVTGIWWVCRRIAGRLAPAYPGNRSRSPEG